MRACSGGRTRLLSGVLIASLVAACASSGPAAVLRPVACRPTALAPPAGALATRLGHGRVVALEGEAGAAPAPFARAVVMA